MIQRLVELLPSLTDGQLHWLERAIEVFGAEHAFEVLDSDLLNGNSLNDFGDALRIHHTLSAEPFRKDKFEYALCKVLEMSGHVASLAPQGNPGHDVTINGTRFSLKTQANKDIRASTIWISKFMELGKGEWEDDPSHLAGLRDAFLAHLAEYQRILTLRNLAPSPRWIYELVEIPKELLLQARSGELLMRQGSTHNTKSGYCYVPQQGSDLRFQLYFDGAGERKLQIQRLQKAHCRVHAVWEFTVPQA